MSRPSSRRPSPRIWGAPATIGLYALTGWLIALERTRAVLVLHDVEGWKHEEIGRELGMAVGSSKAQLHRARGLLRRMLGDTP